MDRLNEIRVPIILMADREDFIYLPENQKELAVGFPNACLAFIDLAGHNPHVEQPAKTIELVRNFLSELKPIRA